MEPLFIGGTNDGVRLNIKPEGLPQVRLLVKARMNPLSLDDLDDQKVTRNYQIEVYNITEWSAEGKRFIMYTFEQMGPAEAMRRLIDGYHRP